MPCSGSVRDMWHLRAEVVTIMSLRMRGARRRAKSRTMMRRGTPSLLNADAFGRARWRSDVRRCEKGRRYWEVPPVAGGMRRTIDAATIGGSAALDENVAVQRAVCEWPQESLQSSPNDEAENGETAGARCSGPPRNAHQCRKCRTPVMIMAMLCSSAAAMTSSSRIEPPG